jgi:hypothetical protein
MMTDSQDFRMLSKKDQKPSMRATGLDRGVLLLVLPLLAFPAWALNTGASLGVGIGYTNNATLSADNERDDWIASASAGLSVSEDSGPLTGAVGVTLDYLDYLRNSYSNQDYLGVNAKLRWAQVKDRLTWQLDDYFAQVPVDSLASDTPGNTQNTNVISFGPDVEFAITPRSKLVLKPVIQDYYYEVTDINNQQLGLAASWMYRLFPTMDAGLDASITRVTYDNETLNPGYRISKLEAALSGTRPRSSYSVNLGTTQINRDMLQSRHGITGSVDLLYNLTGRSSVRTFLLSDLTDASNGFLRSSADPDTGDFTNEQASSDVLRNNTFRITYKRKGSVLDSQIWSELRDLDYAVSPEDRKVQEIGARAGYQVTATTQAGLNGVYRKTRQLNDGRTDKEYVVAGNVAYSLSRSLGINFSLQYSVKDSTVPSSEYTGFSAMSGLVYTVAGKKPRVN